MGLKLPREDLQACSFNVSQRINGLESIHPCHKDPYRQADIARQAIKHFVPDLMVFVGKRLKIVSEGVFVFGEATEASSSFYEGGSFLARLSSLSVEQMTSVVGPQDFEDGIEFTASDIALKFAPMIEDPDPVDLVFGSELVVPMRNLEHIELP